MKKNIFLFFIIGILVSCNTFLEEDVRGILSPNNYFNSEDEIRSAVFGLYTHFYGNRFYGDAGLDRFYTYGTDEIEPSRSGTGELAKIANYQVDEDHGTVENMWKDMYSLIHDCNQVIHKISNTDILKEEVKNAYLGESLFIRSFAYYNLTNIYGDVPYYREPKDLEEVGILGRFDKKIIREDILKDLDFSIKNLPDSYPTQYLGRVTKWAAATLSTKIYLILEDWKSARDQALDIITNSPHRLLENYAEVFNKSTEHNSEIIFQVVFLKDLNPQSKTTSFCPRIMDEPQKSKDKSLLISSLSDRNESFNGTGMAIPTEDLLLSYSEEDLRKSSNVITNYLGINLKFRYMPKMWNLDMINSPRNNHGDDIIIYRLADVYLMAAEAENELNGPTNAYKFINKVRERAFETDRALTGLNKETFRQAIRDERRWELAGEGHRKMDLIRWGILLDVIKELKNTTYGDVSKNIQPHHTLWPIPGAEIRKNPILLESDPTNNGYRK